MKITIITLLSIVIISFLYINFSKNKINNIEQKTNNHNTNNIYNNINNISNNINKLNNRIFDNKKININKKHVVNYIQSTTPDNIKKKLDIITKNILENINNNNIKLQNINYGNILLIKDNMNNEQYEYELFTYNKSKNENIKLKLNIVVYYENNNCNCQSSDSLIVSPMDVIVSGRDFFNTVKYKKNNIEYIHINYIDIDNSILNNDIELINTSIIDNYKIQNNLFNGIINNNDLLKIKNHNNPFIEKSVIRNKWPKLKKDDRYLVEEKNNWDEWGVYTNDNNNIKDIQSKVSNNPTIHRNNLLVKKELNKINT